MGAPRNLIYTDKSTRFRFTLPILTSAIEEQLAPNLLNWNYFIYQHVSKSLLIFYSNDRFAIATGKKHFSIIVLTVESCCFVKYTHKIAQKNSFSTQIKLWQ